MLPKIIAVDFDDTLFTNNYPSIGVPVLDQDGTSTIDKIISLQKSGWYIILWTCRSGDSLQKAIEACHRYEFFPDAINENHPHSHLQFNLQEHEKSRKIYADWYVDDKAINVKHFSLNV